MSSHHYKLRDYQFGQRIMILRKKTGFTQDEMARQVGVSAKTLRNWEGGVHYPTGANLQKLIEIFLFQQAFTRGQELEEAGSLWKQLEQSTSHHLIFDEQWFQRLLEAQVPLSGGARLVHRKESTLILLNTSPPPEMPARTSIHERTIPPVPASFPEHREDWGEALDVSSFVGRKHELEQLEDWVLSQQSRLVVLLGMVGIGKTALATRFAQQVAAHFEVVIWRSLHNAPSPEEILRDCLQLLVDEYAPQEFQSIEQRLSLLIACLRQRRCLLIFDNVATLFQGGEIAGSYRQGYEAYRTLFLRVGESVHQSCLLLTSREKLAELDLLISAESRVRILKMAGLGWEESREVLEDTTLVGAPQVWHELSERYGGNPLTLKIVAGEVQELFGGDLAAFLCEDHLIFHGIRELLTQQVERLSPLEQDVLYLLAIARDLTSLEDLREQMGSMRSGRDLLEALSSLSRRCLIERGERGAVFTLQPVVLGYMTERLVERISYEILELCPVFLLRYVFMRARVKDYVRHSQGQLLLQAVLNRVYMYYCLLSRENIEKNIGTPYRLHNSSNFRPHSF